MLRQRSNRGMFTAADMTNNAQNEAATAKMDGCMFGVGSAAPSGARMVAHANLGGKGANQLSTSIKRQRRWSSSASISWREFPPPSRHGARFCAPQFRSRLAISAGLK
jgi:hypothetical protein